MHSKSIEGFGISVQQARSWRLRGDDSCVPTEATWLLEGELDSRVLRSALGRVVSEHEILRTTYRRLPGMELPIQVVEEGAPFELEELDLGSGGARLERELERLRRESFDLERGPVARFALLRLAPGRTVLFAAVPALAGDSRSMTNLGAEIAAAYGAELGDEAPELERVQYADFAAWQTDSLEESAERLAADREYWRAQLANATLEPLAGSHRLTGAAGVELAAETIDPEALAGGGSSLEALAAQLGGSPEDLLFAVWQILLYRLTGHERFVVGWRDEGRELEALATALGTFARHFPLVCRLGPDFTLDEVLAATSATRAEAEAHAAGLELDDCLPSDDDAPPRLEVGFEVEPLASRHEAGGLVFSQLDVRARLEPFTLSLVWLRRENGGESGAEPSVLGAGPRLEIRYDARRFRAEDAARFAERFSALLASIAAYPRRAIGDFELLSPAERRRLLVEYVSTDRPLPAELTWHGAFEARARRDPEALALIFEGRETSYGELDRRANRAAHGLRRLGVGPEVPVALVMERSIELFVAALGVAKAGGYFVAIEPWQPAERLERMLAQMGAAVVLRTVDELEGESDRPPGIAVDPEQLAYGIFTSGSTGTPKAVAIRHRSLANLGAALEEAVYEGESAPLRVSVNAPLSFDAAIKQLVQLAYGHALVLIPEEVRPDGAALLKYLADHQVEVLDCTPTQLRLLLETGLAEAGEIALRRVLVGGEAIDRALWQALAADGDRRYFNVYGPTECTVDVTACRVTAEPGEPELGAPLANVRVYVTGRRLELAPEGLAGELCVAGEGLARGYARAPAQTAERFVPDPWAAEPGGRLYRSGDLVRRGAGGALEYLGRIDRQVKLRGQRIELGEIEAVLGGHPELAAAAVVLREDVPGSPRLVAYAVPRRARAAASEPAGWRLPNGWRVAHQNRNETAYLYDEIFVKRCYVQHGIGLPEAPVVFDVGANIGMFALFVARHRSRARVFSFEPLPELFATLSENAERHVADAHLLPFGLSGEEHETTFSYYPRYTMMSGQSAYADPASEVEVIKRFLDNERRGGSDASAVLLEQADELLAGRFEAREETVRLRRLSDVVREHGVERIDLLKIDVQRAELDVLRGIDAEDWPKVQQVVMEVHDDAEGATRGRLAELREMLEARGFAVVVEQDPLLVGTDRHNLYARRPEAEVSGPELEPDPALSDLEEAAAPETGPSVGELQELARERLPEAMRPAAIVLLDELPMTRNGKLDTDALPAPEDVEVAAAEPAALSTPHEEILAGIWADVLRIDRGLIGPESSFFDLGGHSLLATQLMSRVREVFAVDLPLRSLFDAPQLVELAARVEDALRTAEGLEAPPIVPRPPGGPAPLSFAQQRLWFFDQLEPGSPAYNAAFAVRLVGRLDLAALQCAFDELVRRHEVLRTTFRMAGEEPVQEIHPPAPIEMPLENLCRLESGEREAALERRISERAARPYDLGRGPLFEVELVAMAEDEHVVLLRAHHIVSDAWSMGVLVRELSVLYEAFAAGRPSPLDELPVQYADFALWQREWLQGEVLERHLDYWRRHLAGSRPEIRLPKDGERGELSETAGRYFRFQLSPELTAGLRQLGLTSGGSLFITLLAGLAAMLYRLSGQEDFVIGTDVANRNRRETEDLIGFFINMLALRFELDGNPSFQRLLDSAREIALGAYAHQDLPFDQLVAELQPERDASHSPLFQVVFVFQNLPEAEIRLSELVMRPVEVGHEPVRFDLSLLMAESPAGLVGWWRYRSDLFQESTIAAWSRRFERLLEAAVADPDTRLDAIELLDEDERREEEVRREERAASSRGRFKSVRRQRVAGAARSESEEFP